MSGYFITQFTINDVETYQGYVAQAIPIIKQYGGKVLIGGQPKQVVEGTPHDNMVVVEFESLDSAQQWYNSVDNQAVKPLRLKSTTGWAIITDSFSRS